MSPRINFLVLGFILVFCSTTVFAQESLCEKLADEATGAFQFKHDGVSAESLLLLALSNRTGCSDDTLLAITTNLGVIYANQKRFYEAESLFREALTLAEKVEGAKHKDFPHYISNLAVACDALGKADEAESLFKKAISRMEEIWGKDGQPLARLLGSYARFLRKENRIIEADTLEKRVQDILNKPNTHFRVIEVETGQN